MTEMVVSVFYLAVVVVAVAYALEYRRSPWLCVTLFAWAGLVLWDGLGWYLVAHTSGGAPIGETVPMIVADFGCIFLSLWAPVELKQTGGGRDPQFLAAVRVMIGYCLLVAVYWGLAFMAPLGFWGSVQAAWQQTPGTPGSERLWGCLSMALYLACAIGLYASAWAGFARMTARLDLVYVVIVGTLALYTGYAPNGHFTWPQFYPRWPALVVAALGIVGWLWARARQPITAPRPAPPLTSPAPALP
jgi:hypothetical protein